MVSTEFKGAGLHYTAFRDAIREDSRQITPSRGVSPRKKFAVKANVESRVTGWSNYFNGGYPNPRYLQVNDYVRRRLIILSKHTSQRRDKLKYAQSYYYEWKAMGLYEMRKRRAQ